MKREQLPEWTTQEWTSIDNAVSVEVESLSVVRKIIPELNNVSRDATVVNLNKIQENNNIGFINENQTIDFKEHSRNFTLTKRQVQTEKTNNAAKTLAIKYTKDIMYDEDKYVFTDLYKDGLQEGQLVSIIKGENEESNSKEIIKGVNNGIKML